MMALRSPPSRTDSRARTSWRRSARRCWPSSSVASPSDGTRGDETRTPRRGGDEMATETVVVTDRNVAQMHQDLAKLLSELEAGQKEMEQGPISQARGEELDRKATEALALQEAIQKYEQRQQLIARGREVVSPTLPVGNAGRKSGRRVVVPRGRLCVVSEAYRRRRQQGKAGTSWPARVDVRNLSGAPVVLYGEEAEAFMKAAQEAIERKQFDPSQLPDIGGDSAVPIQRDPEWVRSEESKP